MRNAGRIMLKHRPRIGMRTLKTAVAVILSMVIVERLGATADKLIFAMLGAMAVVQPTYRESVEACLSQIGGVVFGALVGVLLRLLPTGPLLSTGIGLVLIITVYYAFWRNLSPSLPCFILVLICVTPNIVPLTYAAGRIWDTAIGLGVGLLINMLVFPYDNSRQINRSIAGLDREVIRFLEELFDGDDVFPQPQDVRRRMQDLERQLKIFSDQRLILHFRRQKRQIVRYRMGEEKAAYLLAHMEVLSRMGQPGRLNEESRRRLAACGAEIRDARPLDSVMERDIVTNYHVQEILTLRQELLTVLREEEAGRRKAG